VPERSLKDRTVTEPDESLGVKSSPVVDTLIVDREAWDDSDEPRPEIADLGPGDRIRMCGEEIELDSVGSRVNHGPTGVYRLGIPYQNGRAVSTLWVDRDPYLLDICNGPIQVIEPSEVEVLGSKKTNKGEA